MSQQGIKLKLRDYYELCKPRVVLLMIVTSTVGMILASHNSFPFLAVTIGNAGIALCGFAAAACNHVIDSHIDKKMLRTQNRPVAVGRVRPSQALTLAFVLAVIGFCLLFFFINVKTAVLTLFTLIGYAVIYTAFLKRATAQNIVIGGMAGAMPPLLGWVAVTNSIDPQAWLLVLIIFLWTPPHFWALAMARLQEYALIDIPMMPVVYGREITSLHAFLYSLLLGLACILPIMIGMSGLVYASIAFIINAWFIFLCWKLWRNFNEKRAMKVFWNSIQYLFVLFIALLADHGLGLFNWNIYLV